jgi:hypothetical protein
MSYRQQVARRKKVQAEKEALHAKKNSVYRSDHKISTHPIQ